MVDLVGEVAFVTGASRGIGAATAEALVTAGAKVALAARSNDEIAVLAEKFGDGAVAHVCDVADWASVQSAVAKTEDAFGPVTIMVANAGVIDPISHLATSDPGGWGEAIDVNVKGVYHAARAVLPGMVERGSGRIITIGSGAAHGPLEGWSHYCASKAAALMISRAIHAEAGEKGVASINLSPGTVATQMQVEIKASAMNPVSRLNMSDHISPLWVARAVVWLAGPDGTQFAGEEVKLRDENIRRRIGLV